jgi:UrcA family protein
VRLIIAIAAGLFLASGAPAASVDQILIFDGPTAWVLTGDLDLTTRDGRLALKHRIESAAAKVCGESADEVPEMQLMRRTCYRKAVTQGFEQMSLLTDLGEADAALR